MKLFVVRHVRAGQRSRWKGPDDERPVSDSGSLQADSLADRLAGERIAALVSSPSRRCVQTLEPLAERIGLRVTEDDRLSEGSSVEQSLAVAREVPDRTVLCSHGDVIPDLIAALVRRGMELRTEPDWRKATLWVLNGSKKARRASDDRLLFTSAAVEPPPPIKP